MDLTDNILLISTLVAVISLLVGWESIGRWEFLSSHAQRRLQQAETPVVHSGSLENLPIGSLARKLAESGWKISSWQFGLGSLMLGLISCGLCWTLFLPGLPALLLGGLLAASPTLALNERILSRGLRLDEHLPLALSRIAAGLQAGRGLDEVLEITAGSLPEGCPLTYEFIKSAQDIRSGDAQEAMRKLAERSASASLSNVAMLLESYLRAGGGQYAGTVSETAVQIQRIISTRNHARAKAAQALQSAKLIPLIMGGVLVMMASDPATAQSFQTGTVQIVIAMAMGLMLLGFLQMRSEIRRVV